MQVVILAGGKGTRLRPLTYRVPKPMVPVCGKPFLEHQLDLLKSQGLTRVLLLVSYLGRQIESYFGNGESHGMSIRYAYEPSPLGTGGALRNARSALDDRFLLLNGDTLLPIEYRLPMERFCELGCEGLVVAYDNSDPVAPNNLRVDGRGLILSYHKEDCEGMSHVDAGAIVLDRCVVDRIEQGCVCSLEKEIFPQLIAHHKLFAYPTSLRFYDMGSFSGLKQIERVLQ